VLGSGPLDAIGTHPGIARRALAWAADNNNPPFSILEEILMADPALVAHVLRLANSSLFGKPGRIATLAHAAALTDRHLVRVACLHFHLVDSQEPVAQDQFWRRSWTRSRVAGHFAPLFSHVSVDEARVAGLLAEIGTGPSDSLANHDTSHRQIYRRSAQWMREASFPSFLADAIDGLASPQTIEKLGTQAAELATILCMADAWTGETSTFTDVENGESPATADSLDEVAFLAEEITNDLARIDKVFAPSDLTNTDLLVQTRQTLVEIGIAHAHALTHRARLAEHHQKRAKEYKKERDFLRTQVTLDPFLGIANRKHFDLRLAEEFKRCSRSRQSLSLILFDIDRFKKLNDTYYHQAGDEVLQSVTRAMQGCLRTTDLFARYGGEEFAVICPETDIIGGLALAERMRHTLENLQILHQGLTLQVTASFGLATIDEPTEINLPAELIEVADYLLYQAKRSGRNCVRHGACPHPLVPVVANPST
jgi:diguanylate cyclase (GGDEF)-like protein